MESGRGILDEEKDRTDLKTWKKILALVLTAAMLMTVMACSASAKSTGSSAKAKLKIASIADPHVIANDLLADNTGYWHMRNKTPKMQSETEAILDAQLDKVREEKPDVLVIPGDMTKDGEAETHQIIEKKLEKLKKDMPKLFIYVINGNHDQNNKNAENYAAPMVDGKAAKATRTSPEMFREIYKVTYEDPSIIARFTPAPGKVAGQESYAARPVPGFTFIAVDTNCYSSDNTTTGKDEHQTRGAISPELEQWTMDQIKAARDRGDAVIGIMHHNIVPHFTMESTIESIYLLDDYTRIGSEFADAGMHIVFTGHTHEQDVTQGRSAKGNDLFDIETGSGAAYPAAMRIVDVERGMKNGGETLKMTGRTIDHLSINYYDAVEQKQRYIPDVTEYARNNMLTQTMLEGYLTVNLEDAFAGLGMECPQVVKDEVVKLVDNACRIPVTADGKHTLIEFADYLYCANCAGTDDGNYPDWVKEAFGQIENGAILNQVSALLAIWLNTLPGDVASDLIRTLLPADALSALNLNPQTDVYSALINAAGKFTGYRGPVKKALDSLLYDLADSFGHDTNYPDDREFTETLTTVASGVMNNGKTCNPAEFTKDTPEYRALKAVMKALQPKN